MHYWYYETFDSVINLDPIIAIISESDTLNCLFLLPLDIFWRVFVILQYIPIEK